MRPVRFSGSANERRHSSTARPVKRSFSDLTDPTLEGGRDALNTTVDIRRVLNVEPHLRVRHTMIFTSSQLFAASLLSLTLYVVLRRKRRGPYPPGPKSLPLIGNLRDIPLNYQWLTYERWGRETGEYILSLSL